MNVNNNMQEAHQSNEVDDIMHGERESVEKILSGPEGFYKPSFQKQLSEACPPKSKIGTQLVEMFERDHKRAAEDAMKKRAILTAGSYEEFKNLVAASTLKPLKKDDDITQLTKKGFNPIINVEKPKRKYDLQMSLQQLLKPSSAAESSTAVSLKTLSSLPSNYHDLERQWRRLKPSQELPSYSIRPSLGQCANELCEQASQDSESLENTLLDASQSSPQLVLQRDLLLRLGKSRITCCFQSLGGDYDFMGEIVAALKPESTAFSLSTEIGSEGTQSQIQGQVSHLFRSIPSVNEFSCSNPQGSVVLTPFCPRCTLQLLSSIVFMEILRTVPPDTLDMALHLLTPSEKQGIAMSFKIYSSMGGCDDSLLEILHGIV